MSFFRQKYQNSFKKRNSRSKVRTPLTIMFYAQNCIVLMRWVLHSSLATNLACTKPLRSPEEITRDKNIVEIKNSEQYLQADNGKKSHQFSLEGRTFTNLHEIANSIFLLTRTYFFLGCFPKQGLTGHLGENLAVKM